MPAPRSWRERAVAAARRWRRNSGRGFALVLAAVLLPVSGHAQVAGSLSLQSDYRARGYSITDHRPALTLQVSLDAASGVYGNLALTGSVDGADDPVVKAMAANIGYARRLSPQVSLDAGYIHTRYLRFAQAPGRADVDYDEVYLGAVLGRVAYHAYYSPDYLGSGIGTLYNEVTGSVALPGRLRAHALLGLTTYLGAPAGAHLASDCRWAAGVSRPVGPVTLDLTLDGGSSNLKRFFHDRHPGETRLVGGISLAF